MLRFVVLASFVALALGFPHSGGLPKLDGRIVGGDDAEIEDYPYQISLQFLGSHICGGSIIGSKYVVTAAHCTDETPASYLSIRYGSTIRNKAGTTVNIARIHQNPNFTMRDMDFDVSILVLEDEIKLGSNAQTIELGKSDPQEGANTVCTGWGTTSSGGYVSDILQKVNLPIISRQNCRNAYGYSKITDNMICAGYLGVGGKDACQGDSGGPLVSEGKLVGIVSWGYGCADPNYPGIFSNVATLRDYILENSDN